MPRIANVRNSFLGGEISKRAQARIDLPQYNHAFEELRNFIVQPQGGARRRPGFQYIKSTAGGVVGRGIPFVFSQSEAYFIEITSGTPAVFRSVDANSLAVTNPTASTTVPSYAVGDLPEIQYAQVADLMWIVHPDFYPIVLARQSAGAFNIHLATSVGPPVWKKIYTNNQGIPFQLPNASAVTLQPSAVAGAITVTASAAMFVPGMIGSIWKITQTNAGNRYTGVFQITAVGGGGPPQLACTANVLENFVNITADADWEEAAWSDYRGWPRTVCFFEGRIYYGGSRSFPDTVWASRSGDYFDLDARGLSPGAAGFPAINNASPYDFSPAAGQVNEIQWMSPGKSLPIGTLGQEFVARGPDQTLAMGIENISVPSETAHGSAYIQAARVSYALSFVQRSKQKIRELVFDFNSDSYVATDIGLFAEHLFRGGIKQLAWQEFPDGVLWGIDESGNLFGLTRERQQQIASFHSHLLAGDSDGVLLGNQNPIVHSICSIPSATGKDYLWAIVQLRINGADAYYVVRSGDEYLSGALSIDKCQFLEYWKYATDAGGLITWTGFSHLAGEVVKVLASDTIGGLPNYEGEFTVTAGGNIVLNRSVKSIMAGKAYKSRAKTLKMKDGSAIGSARGAMKRTDKLLLWLYDSWGLSFGSNTSALKEITFWSNNMPGLIEPFTGEKLLDFPDGWDRDGQTVLETDHPFPCNIGFIQERAVVNDV